MAWNKPFVYFGTSDFSKKILEDLVQNKAIPQLIVTTQSKPSGRGLKVNLGPVAQFAQDNNLPYLTVKSLKNGLPDDLLANKTPFAILAAFGKILPVELLDLYEYGIINVHPSLLPKFRGASPIQSTLLADEKNTGVSLIKLDAEVDHGPILSQASLIIGNDDAIDLENKLAKLAVEQLLINIPEYLSGQIKIRQQDHNQATFSKQITKQDGQANFALSAKALDNQRRAFVPWPGLWTSWQGKRLKLINTSVIELPLKNGQVNLVDKNVVVGCADNSALIIKELQLADGKIQSASSFINGHKNFIGSILPN